MSSVMSSLAVCQAAEVAVCRGASLGSTTKEGSAISVHWLAVTCTSEKWRIPITAHVDCSRWMVVCRTEMYWSLLLQIELCVLLVFGDLLAAFQTSCHGEAFSE